MNTPIVSIIIPTFNKSEYLELTLSTFAQQSFENFQIIVVDDGSVDDTNAVIRRQEDSRILGITQANRGRSAARNAGLNAARGEIIIFCDDDRLVGPTFVERHVQALRAAPRSVILGYKKRVLTIWKRAQLPLEQHEWLSVAGRTPGLASRMEQNDLLRLVDRHDLSVAFNETIDRCLVGDEPDNHLDLLRATNYDLTRFRLPWALGTTANMSVLREYLIGEPAFDESYFGWGLEDTDLCYRLHKMGLHIRFDPTAVNYHQIHPLGESTLREDAAQRSRDFHRNLFQFCNKFPTLESCLFWRSYGSQDLLAAHELLEQVQSDSRLHDELLWAYREVLRLNDPGTGSLLKEATMSGQYITIARARPGGPEFRPMTTA